MGGLLVTSVPPPWCGRLPQRRWSNTNRTAALSQSEEAADAAADVAASAAVDASEATTDETNDGQGTDGGGPVFPSFPLLAALLISGSAMGYEERKPLYSVRILF